MNIDLNNLGLLAENYKTAKTQNLRNKVVMQTFTIIYFNLEKMSIIIRDEDKRNDFLLEFYEKIPRIFETFNPDLSSFKTYLTNKLKFAAMNFIRNLQTSKLKENILIHEEFNRINSIIEDFENSGNYNFYTSESKYKYEKNFKEKVIENKAQNVCYKNMPINHRRIFLLACKSCLFLDDEMIEKISEELNIPFQFLFNIINTLKNMCRRRKDNIDKTVYKINKYYIKTKITENLLKLDKENYSLYAKNKKSYIANSKFFYQAKQMNNKQIKCPSNAMIGKQLNIKRGTVDKNIYTALKNGIVIKNI